MNITPARFKVTHHYHAPMVSDWQGPFPTLLDAVAAGFRWWRGAYDMTSTDTDRAHFTVEDFFTGDVVYHSAEDPAEWDDPAAAAA